MAKPGTIGSMQNTDRWRSNQFQPTHTRNTWPNKTDANLEDSACTLWALLFFPKETTSINTIDFGSKVQKIYGQTNRKTKETLVATSSLDYALMHLMMDEMMPYYLKTPKQFSQLKI